MIGVDAATNAQALRSLPPMYLSCDDDDDDFDDGDFDDDGEDDLPTKSGSATEDMSYTTGSASAAAASIGASGQHHHHQNCTGCPLSHPSAGEADLLLMQLAAVALLGFKS
eukprot:TRINITY_DN500_c0_g1_i2.p2 TRINITY_DN500_c0_g1~~TRINITY_DN500_c0_g1_i2.p2  ORF type:complete len:111 (-),score=29.09 TRINITY_DN500_c0_g1_i2:66-398(-)